MRSRWLGALALWAPLACSQGTARPPEPASTAAPVEVTIARVEAQEIAEPIWGTGTLEADKQVDIGPRVDGIIEEIFVDVGDRVQAGQKLFRTRDSDYRIRVAEAEHALHLGQAEAHKADRDRERAEELFRSKIVSIEQIEGIRTAHDAARARLGQAETALERARQDLEDSVVRAPYAGAITQRFVDEGVMLRTMLTSGTAVVQLMKLDVVVAVVRVAEVHLRRIALGTGARLHLDGFDQPFEGRVAIVSDRVDPGSRSIELRVPIPNPDLALKPGAFAKVEIAPTPRRALVLERRAVRGRAPDSYVFVGESGLAMRRGIGVRDLDAERLEVLWGLEAGAEVLVSRPDAQLTEGAPFTVSAGHAPL